MSNWDYSVVILVPKRLKAKANRLSCALGYDNLPGNTFAVPLIKTGNTTVSFYGCRTYAKLDFIEMLENWQTNDTFAEIDLSEFNLTTEDVIDILTNQILSYKSSAEAGSHFYNIIKENDLVIAPEYEDNIVKAPGELKDPADLE